MDRIFLLFVFLFGLSFHQDGKANPLSDESLYRRCYGEMVRKRPEANDLLLEQVKKKEISPVEACLKLLEKASLGNQGRVDTKDPIALAILKTFQDLHSSWFPNHDLMNHEFDHGTTNVVDSNEMGYYFTKALLDKQTPLSSLLTSPLSLRGLREFQRKTTHVMDPEQFGTYEKVGEFPWRMGKEGKSELKPKMVEFGLLQGIDFQPAPNNPVEVDIDGTLFSSDLNLHLGGGLLGSSSYIFLSSTLPTLSWPDQGLKTHRGWSRSVFSDLLCRDLPVLREEDVKNHVDQKSNLAFRTQTKCMQCHSSIDGMAAVLRNVGSFNSATRDPEQFNPRVLLQKKADHQASWNQPIDPKFNESFPEGALYFRNNQGNLVDIKVKDISHLGEVISQQKDFYDCVASRYFKFFTGIEVPLQEIAKKTPSRHRQFISQLGSQLQSHQSVKKMIQEILGSDDYKKSDFGGATSPRLADRFYLESILLSLYGPHAHKTVDQYIYKNETVMGGSCDYYSQIRTGVHTREIKDPHSFCENGKMSANISMLGGPSPVRFSLLSRTCEVLNSNTKTLNHFFKKVFHQDSPPYLSSQNINLAFKAFNPGHEAPKNFIEIFAKEKLREPASVGEWKPLLLSLCIDPQWQML